MRRFVLMAAFALAIVVIAGLAYATWGPRPVTGQWGPMAVSRERVGGDMARSEGILRISDRCVLLDHRGTAAILVWFRDQVTWVAAERMITFEKQDGRVVELRDGQPIAVGGSGEFLSFESPSVEGRRWVDWVASIDWAAEPDPACMPDSNWHVGDVELDL